MSDVSTGTRPPEPQPYSETAEQADSAGKLELATVTSVDTQRFTCSVMTETTHKPLQDVQFAGLYSHNNHPGAVLVMPEIGSHCYVMTAGKEDSFIFGFRQTSIREDANAPESKEFANSLQLADNPNDDSAGPSFKGYKPSMEPGDIYLGTRDNNRIFVRRGGLIQIEATPLCQTIYVPTENLIRHYCQTYEFFSPLAEISFKHASLVEGEKVTGKADATPVLISYNYKRQAQEDVSKHFSVEVRLGQLDQSNLDPEKDQEHIFANDDVYNKPLKDPYITQEQEGLLSFTVYDHETAKSVTLALQVTKGGDLYLKATNIHVDATTVFAKLADSLTIEFGGDSRTLELDSKGDLKAYVRACVVDAIKELTIKSPDIEINNNGGVLSIVNSKTTVIDAATIKLGGNSASQYVVVDNGFLQALASHTHKGTATVAGTAGVVTTLVDPALAKAVNAASKTTKAL